MSFRWPWAREERANPSSGLAVPADWLTDAMASTSATSGQTVTVLKALGIAPVFAATSLIAEQVGQLPLNVYKTVESDSSALDYHRVEARQHRAWRLLHEKPNHNTPAGRFWSIITTHLLLWGNAFILKERDPYTGVVDSLWALHPSQMVVKYDPARRIKSYEYQPRELVQKEFYNDSQVLHIMGLSQDGLVGESVIARVRNAFGQALARDEFEGMFYKRGAVLSGVVEAPEALSDQARSNVKGTINEIYGGSGKAFQIGVLEENAKFHVLGMPLKDLEFVANQQLTRVDVAVMFKLPPNYLGGSSGDSLTYSTVEMNRAALGLNAIAPWTHTIAEAITQDESILPQRQHEAEFDLNQMFRADLDSRVGAYEKLVKMKAMLPNEVRAAENRAPIPGGDKFPEDKPPVAPKPAAGPVPSMGNDNVVEMPKRDQEKR
jgi:HK97 family phage portal protein